jgi:hypothetical protein
MIAHNPATLLPDPSCILTHLRNRTIRRFLRTGFHDRGRRGIAGGSSVGLRATGLYRVAFDLRALTAHFFDVKLGAFRVSCGMPAARAG